jgi:hypothetical protein
MDPEHKHKVIDALLAKAGKSFPKPEAHSHGHGVPHDHDGDGIADH